MSKAAEEIQNKLKAQGGEDTATADPQQDQQNGQQSSQEEGAQNGTQSQQEPQPGSNEQEQTSEQNGGENAGEAAEEQTAQTQESSEQSAAEQHPTQSELEQRLKSEIGEVDADSVIERVKSYDQLKQKVEELENKDPFANETVKQFNDLVKNGADESQIKTWFELNSKDIDNLRPEEQRKLKLQLENGFTAQEAEEEIKDNYYVRKENEDGEETFELNETKLTRDNKRENVLQSLKERKTELAKPPENKDEGGMSQEQFDQLINTAKQEAQNLDFEKLRDVTLIEDSENPDNNLSYSISVDESFRKQLPQLAEQFVSQTGKDLSQQETKQQFRDYAEMIYWRQNGDQIVKNAAKHAWSKATEQAANKYQNSGQRRSGDTPEGEGQQKLKTDHFVNNPKKVFDF